MSLLSLARAAVRSALLAGIVLAAGCGDDPTEDSLGGMGLPSQRGDESYPGPRTELAGQTVLRDSGCFHVSVDGLSRLAIWPRGSEHDGATLLTPTGERVGDGTRVQGVGTVLPVTALRGVPDGYWGSVLSFCAPDATTVLVFDDVSVAGG